MGNRSGAGSSSRSQAAMLAEIRRQNAADAKRRRSILVATAAIVAVVVAVTVVALLLAGRDDGPDETGADPTGLTDTTEGVAGSGGFAVGEEGPVQVAVYLDYQCPSCRTYEEAHGDYLAELEAGSDATVVYRPIAILDRVTGDGIYSSRSAGAAACVGETGDDEAFSRFSDLLYAEQPAEADAGTGLADERLAELAAEAGAGDGAEQCILERRYVDWAGRTTAAAAEVGVTGTPTVTVDGEVVSNDAGGPPDPEQLQAAVDAALSDADGSTETDTDTEG